MKTNLISFTLCIYLIEAFSNDWFSNVKRSPEATIEKPNIIIITTTDLGWDDISLHGNPLAITPNIDTFSKHGLTLNNHYISGYEFATRVELMTGKYASRLGLQQDLISNTIPLSLSENITLPKILKEQGYSNHFVGKWGLGFNKISSLPTSQGFDSFYGSISNLPLDYYNFTSTEGNYTGYDLYNNTEPASINRTYSQTLFTDVATDIIYDAAKKPGTPFFLCLSLQIPQPVEGVYDNVPEHWFEYFSNIYTEKSKKNHAAMIMALDVSIGRIMDSLAASSILEKSVILIIPQSTSKACNSTEGGGCNYPFRGGRGTVWEGGIRSAALFYSSFIKTHGQTIDEMIHVTDWLPTLATLAKYDISKLTNLDGVNILSTLTDKKETKRTYMLFDIETNHGEVMALRMHEYKLVIGQRLGSNSGWNKERVVTKEQTDSLLQAGFKPNGDKPKNYSSIVLCNSGYPHPFLSIHAPPCKPTVEPCLFNLDWDPCEYHNLAGFMQRTANFILSKLIEIKRNIVIKPIIANQSEYADPKLYNGYWHWWENDTKSENTITYFPPLQNTILKTENSTIDNSSLLLNNTQNEVIFEKNSIIKANKSSENQNKTHFEKDIYGEVEMKNKNLKDDKPLSDSEIENMWNVEHQTLNLNHYKNLKNSNRSSNLNNSFSLNSSDLINSTLSELFNANLSYGIQNQTLINSNSSENTTKPSEAIEKNEVLEIYVTPSTDSDINVFSINSTIPEQFIPQSTNEETGYKRTNLPSNTEDYKIAVSKGSTYIQNASPQSTDAFLKTKAIAGNEYDEKSNTYSSEKQITSLDDENLKILSSDSETAKVYTLHQDLNETKNNGKNTSVEEFFIDWNLLSKEAAIITKPPEYLPKSDDMNIPNNLVTPEPLSPKSFLFEPYMQDENRNIEESPMFQRTIIDNPKTSTYVVAHSDADKQTAINEHKLKLGTESERDEFLKNIKQSIQPVTAPTYDPVASYNVKKDFGSPSESFSTKIDLSLPNPSSSLDKVHEKFIIDNTHTRLGDNELNVVFDQLNGNKVPFHGSLNVGNSHRYEFEGVANDVNIGDIDTSAGSSHKYIETKSNEEPNHIYGINVLQPSQPQANFNKTEITESASNIKSVNQENKFNSSIPIGNINENNQKEILQQKVVRSFIPESGVIGDESSNSQNADDIFKIFTNIDNGTKFQNDETAKDLTAKALQISSIINDLPMILSNQTYVNQNGTTVNITVMSIDNKSNDTNPEKKGYPITLPYKSPVVSSSVASTVVAVVLSAFVIIGMALIAIVALVSKSYGKNIPTKNIPVAQSPVTSLSPSGSGNLSPNTFPPSPRRHNRLNR